jgi:hypothetical protein
VVDDSNVLDQLISRIDDPALRDHLAREVDHLALDLTAAGIDALVAKATNGNLIEELFTERGMAYP